MYCRGLVKAKRNNLISDPMSMGNLMSYYQRVSASSINDVAAHIVPLAYGSISTGINTVASLYWNIFLANRADFEVIINFSLPPLIQGIVRVWLMPQLMVTRSVAEIGNVYTDSIPYHDIQISGETIVKYICPFVATQAMQTSTNWNVVYQVQSLSNTTIVEVEVFMRPVNSYFSCPVFFPLVVSGASKKQQKPKPTPRTYNVQSSYRGQQPDKDGYVQLGFRDDI